LLSCSTSQGTDEDEIVKPAIRTYTAALALAWLLVAPLEDARTEQDPSATVKAATQLTRWFGDLLRPFQEIGAIAEKQHLIDALVDLNRDLFEVEQEKRYVIIALLRRPLVHSELQQTSDALGAKIGRLRQSLLSVGPKLRIAYRAGADEAIALLSEALVTRKGFVYNLGSVTEATAEQDISEAQAAILALDQAQRKLADVIAALQKP
jgi:hypothetical protein